MKNLSTALSSPAERKRPDCRLLLKAKMELFHFFFPPAKHFTVGCLFDYHTSIQYNQIFHLLIVNAFLWIVLHLASVTQDIFMHIIYIYIYIYIYLYRERKRERESSKYIISNNSKPSTKKKTTVLLSAHL